MFVDAAAIVAILARESEAERCIEAATTADKVFTSPIAVWEAAMALARRDKLALPVPASFDLVTQFVLENGIELRQLPRPKIWWRCLHLRRRVFAARRAISTWQTASTTPAPDITRPPSSQPPTNSDSPISTWFPDPPHSRWTFLRIMPRLAPPVAKASAK